MSSQRLFSGIQPTGNLHLGNYLGAVQNWIAMQEGHDAIFCVVDLHAITVPQHPEVLRRNTMDTVRTFLAAGIDPQQSIVFAQSQVSGHAELAWLLNTIARMSDLEKMTQFKDKSRREGAESATIGLFDYPVLMAADILLYDTAIVPVGEDQVQHIELARVLARRFNATYGETFVVPEARVREEGARIMGLDDPANKMSKSAPSEYNYIALTDDADTVRRKIKRAVTDSGRGVIYSEAQPAVKNLLTIYGLLSGEDPATTANRYRDTGYGAFKSDLADVVVNFLMPLQERMAAISDDDVLHVLSDGAMQARAIADQKITTVKEKMGFVV